MTNQSTNQSTKIAQNKINVYNSPSLFNKSWFIMKVAFFVSSVGDTDLALSTIKSMESKGENQALLISLTKTAQERVESFSSTLLVDKKTLPEILHLLPEIFLDGYCNAEQLERIVEYIKLQEIHHAYFGIPSVNNEIPFQIAAALDSLPVLMAYGL